MNYIYKILNNEAALIDTNQAFDKLHIQDSHPAREDKPNTHAVLMYTESEGVFWVYIPFTPSEMREQAYETEKCITFDSQTMTVDEANDMWVKYNAEGSAKATELTALIADAKAEIRRRYPDENLD